MQQKTLISLLTIAAGVASAAVMPAARDVEEGQVRGPKPLATLVSPTTPLDQEADVSPAEKREVIIDERDIDGHLQKRSCFATGERIDPFEEEGLRLAREACETRLSGTYDHGEEYETCYNIPRSNKHIKFKLGLTGHNAGSWRTIGADECYDGLRKEVYYCPKGGETTYGNWKYRADPNKNSCP